MGAALPPRGLELPHARPLDTLLHELVLLDPLAGRLRERGAQLEEARDHVARQPLLEPVVVLGEVELPSLPGHHVELDLVLAELTRYAERRGLEDVGMAERDELELRGRHVLAAAA